MVTDPVVLAKHMSVEYNATMKIRNNCDNIVIRRKSHGIIFFLLLFLCFFFLLFWSHVVR